MSSQLPSTPSLFSKGKMRKKIKILLRNWIREIIPVPDRGLGSGPNSRTRFQPDLVSGPKNPTGYSVLLIPSRKYRISAKERWESEDECRF